MVAGPEALTPADARLIPSQGLLWGGSVPPRWSLQKVFGSGRGRGVSPRGASKCCGQPKPNLGVNRWDRHLGGTFCLPLSLRPATRLRQLDRSTMSQPAQPRRAPLPAAVHAPCEYALLAVEYTLSNLQRTRPQHLPPSPCSPPILEQRGSRVSRLPRSALV